MSYFALCTVVADVRHLAILDDWLKFLSTKPSELVIRAGPRPSPPIPALQKFSDDREIALNLIVVASANEIPRNPAFDRSV